jgi:hypothetical protein
MHLGVYIPPNTVYIRYIKHFTTTQYEQRNVTGRYAPVAEPVKSW